MSQQHSKHNIQLLREKAIVNQRLLNFDSKKCRANQYLTAKFGHASQSELLKIARAISQVLDLPLEREATRRKSVLLKWFDDRLAIIQPFIEEKMVIGDFDGIPIGNYRCKLLDVYRACMKQRQIGRYGEVSVPSTGSAPNLAEGTVQRELKDVEVQCDS